MDAIATQAANLRAQDALSAGLQARASANLGAQNPNNLAKVKDAAQQFEAFFVGQMMEYMTAGIKADGNFGGGQAEETWRSMMNQEYGKQVAKSGRLGIADTVMTAMLKAQEQRTEAMTQATAAPQTASEPPAESTGSAVAAGSLVVAAKKPNA